MLRVFFPLEMFILVLNFLLLFYLLTYFYTSLQKINQTHISCGRSTSPLLCVLFFLYQQLPRTTHFFISVWKEMICDRDSLYNFQIAFLGNNLCVCVRSVQNLFPKSCG